MVSTSTASMAADSSSSSIAAVSSSSLAAAIAASSSFSSIYSSFDAAAAAASAVAASAYAAAAAAASYSSDAAANLAHISLEVLKEICKFIGKEQLDEVLESGKQQDGNVRDSSSRSDPVRYSTDIVEEESTQVNRQDVNHRSPIEAAVSSSSVAAFSAYYHQRFKTKPMSERRSSVLPVMVMIYLILGIACSAVWLYSFNLQIFEPPRSRSHQRIALLVLLVVYAIHLPVVMILPFISRPWLWAQQEEKPRSLGLMWGLLGWDEGGDNWCNCLLCGARAAASFLLAWGPYVVFPTRASHASLAGILGMTLEGFFVAEMVKHTEGEDGFFFCQMAAAVGAAQRLFGLGGGKWWIVFSVCILLILLHSVLPFYEDVFTLLPEPHVPVEATIGLCFQAPPPPPKGTDQLGSTHSVAVLNNV